MKSLQGKGSAIAASSGQVRLTEITVEATCDWARAIIEGTSCVFVAPPDGRDEAAADGVGKLLLERNENSEEIGIWRSVRAQQPVRIRGYVASDQPYLTIKLGHGDNGWIRISSPIDSVINEINCGDGQNFVCCRLALTADAKKAMEGEKGRVVEEPRRRRASGR